MEKKQYLVKWQKKINKTSYVTSVTCNVQRNKKLYIKIWYQEIHLTGTEHTRNDIVTQNQLLHMQSCHQELQQKMTCVSCNRPMQKHVCKMNNKEDYDFSYFVVSQCLQHLANSTHEVQYIYAYLVTKH